MGNLQTILVLEYQVQDLDSHDLYCKSFPTHEGAEQDLIKRRKDYPNHQVIMVAVIDA